MAAKGCVDNVSALLRKISLFEGEIIVLKAQRIIGLEHAQSAVYHAMRSFERGENFARTIGVETLLYLSGERQISRALENLGLEPGDDQIAIITFGSDGEALISSLGWTRDDSLLLLNEEKTQYVFNTLGSSEHLKPIDQMLEKVALLDINK